jgi:hypothetical protein
MLQETSKIWMDGKFVDWKDARVRTSSHTRHRSWLTPVR